jgi:hypothetical protein
MGSNRLIISARPKSEAEFVLALVKITPEGGVEVRVEPYARVGSDWRVLGSMFRHQTVKEVEDMTGQISCYAKGKIQNWPGSQQITATFQQKTRSPFGLLH